ncbi:MAG: cysteine desulfurase family protein [Nitrospirota bacterium]
MPATMTPIYLDHIAAAKPHPEVVAAMLPWLTEEFGNPMSLHRFGERPRAAVEEARALVASLLGSDPRELTFTGSGTESNTLALRGLMAPLATRGRHLIVSAIEHSSVLDTARRLEREGAALTIVPVDRHGVVDPGAVAAAMRRDTVLVSIQTANPEIGTLQPIADIARLVRERGALIHTDAIAAAGRWPLDAGSLGVDALSLSANPLYGPPGVAVLYVRRGARLDPQLVGGAQESGRRSGGHNVPAIVGMGRAAAITREHGAAWHASMRALHRRLADGLSKIMGVVLTGHPDQRVAGHVSACVEYVEGEALVRTLEHVGMAAASGSACSDFTVSSKVSHVLTALGIETTRAQGSVVFSLGRETTEADVHETLRVLPPIIDQLRRVSPLYRATP